MEVLASAGKTDDVACGVNVRDIGLIVFVNFDFASRVGFHAGRWEIEPIAIRLTANGINECVTLYFFPLSSSANTRSRLRIDSNARHFFAKTKGRSIWRK